MANTIPFEAKMQTTSFCWFLNLFLALIIFYSAELGRLLGVQGQPLAISVLWPATGFSLAALLLFGFKAWPGIFLGNFCYNFFHFYPSNLTLTVSLSTSIIISTGSLIQALVGGFIIQRFTSPGYFNTVRDIFVFLIFGGILTCFIASTIGTCTLYFYGTVPWNLVFYTWLTFLIGDSMGVYIFTPLIVVWALYKPIVSIRKYPWETIFMVLAFILISLLSSFYNYPSAHLFIPLSLWVSYRFRMHGATFAIFFISLINIIPASLGQGSFMVNLITNQLIILVSFLEVIVATSLVLAAIVNEREAVLHLIQNQNVDLQQAVAAHMDDLKEMISEVSIKEKFSSHGLLTSNIAKHIQVPLKTISNFTQASIDCLGEIRNSWSSQKETTSPESSITIQNKLKTLENYLQNIVKFGTHAYKIAKIIQEQANLINLVKHNIKSSDIKTLLNTCLNQAIAEQSRIAHPEFKVTVIKQFDNAVKVVLPFSEDIARALLYLFNYALYSMETKRNLLGNEYDPVLEVHTIDHKDKLEIIIRDNGIGIPENQLKNFFQSFIGSKQTENAADLLEESTNFGLSLAHDIIVHVHHGDIKVSSKENEYFQFALTIPK